MFENQFAMARSTAGRQLPPVCVYAVETAIQMTLTELNENLREIYLEAYTQKEASEHILRETAKELFGIFGPYQPELTLEKKLRLFLMMNLRAYHVPEAEIAQAVAFIEGLNMSFDDAFDVSGYAVPAMQWACGAGVMQGANRASSHRRGNLRADGGNASPLLRGCSEITKPISASALSRNVQPGQATARAALPQSGKMSVCRQLSLYKPQIICYNSFAFRKRYALVAQLDRVTDSDVSAPFG